jgi:hypothetical protein
MAIGIALMSAFALVASGCGLMSWRALSTVGVLMACLGILLFVFAVIFAIGAAVVKVISWLVKSLRRGDS